MVFVAVRIVVLFVYDSDDAELARLRNPRTRTRTRARERERLHGYAKQFYTRTKYKERIFDMFIIRLGY